MANNDEGLTGSELQASQSGGASGEFGGNREQQQGQPEGGGATASDLSQAGGSSGTGGYGSSQNVVNQRDQQPAQGSQSGLAGGDLSTGGGGGAATGQSRGERFDEEQGGGRGVLFEAETGSAEFAEDQAAHQDRGQSEAADFEREEES
jgi:hypothetical protein